MQRHNSWDLLFGPLPVLRDLAGSLLAPWDHGQVWAITLVYAVLFGGWTLCLELLAASPDGTPGREGEGGRRPVP